MIMSVLSGNLTEGQTSVPANKSEVKSISSSKSNETSVDIATLPSSNIALAPKSNVYTSIKFSLTMESLIIDLFMGGSKSVNII